MVTLCAESSTFLTSDNWFFDVSSRRIGFRGVCSCACCLSVMKKFKHVLDPSNILHLKFRKVKITGEEESYWQENHDCFNHEEEEEFVILACGGIL
jgi:hypothetical protein